MSIRIYNDNNNKEIESLCEDIWDLPTQIYELEKWLNLNGNILPRNKYVADIGFDIRKDATGGGTDINIEMINMLSNIGMRILLSEYPNMNKL